MDPELLIEVQAALKSIKDHERRLRNLEQNVYDPNDDGRPLNEIVMSLESDVLELQARREKEELMPIEEDYVDDVEDDLFPGENLNPLDV